MKIHTWKTALQAVVAVALVVSMATVKAAVIQTVTYYLNDSNLSGFSPTGLPDGTNYVSVKMDLNDNGQIDFIVTPLDPPLQSPGQNYGIQDFGFNINGIAYNDITITGLDSDWTISTNS